MKSHLFKINICIHSISIHVSFPCAVGASLQIGIFLFLRRQSIVTNYWQYRYQASTIVYWCSCISRYVVIVQSTNKSLFSKKSKVHFYLFKAVVNFFLRTKSGKLQAGSTAIFLNKNISGCTRENAPINKCSDR